jgi:predicted small lipoprotein YifL
MKTTIRNLLLGASLAATLAACGGPGGGKDTPPAPPTVVATSQEDKFGVKFGQNFRAPKDGEPSPVNDGDLVPVSWTTEPIDIVH